MSGISSLSRRRARAASRKEDGEILEGEQGSGPPAGAIRRAQGRDRPAVRRGEP